MRQTLFSILLAVILCLNAPFYLTIYGQHVAVYEAGTGRWYVTDTPAASLPPGDQDALRRGIPLDSAMAGTAALEDFCS